MLPNTESVQIQSVEGERKAEPDNAGRKIFVVPQFCFRETVCRFNLLFGAEDTVAAVAQAGNNVLVFVELFVQSSAKYLNIRMSVGQSV